MNGDKIRKYFVAIATIMLLVLSASVFFGERHTVKEAKEHVLEQDLTTLRALIIQYTLDNKHRPQAPADLITRGYLKKMPVDPMTGRDDTWVYTWSANVKDPGIEGVRSGSQLKSSNGRRYSQW